MAVSTLPLLPADYPLFDWADWPTDRAALVELGETQNFRAACWAAIVETLIDALDTAGIAHEDDLELVDGLLYAYKFNALLDTIADAADLNWRWAYDPTYRGYIGREKMIGTGDAGSETYGDIVYPEYILDIAARVNLIIELLRGTAETTSSGASVLVPVPFLTAPLAGKGAAIVQYDISRACLKTAPLAGKGLLGDVSHKRYYSNITAHTRTNRGVIINMIRRILTPHRLPGTSREACLLAVGQKSNAHRRARAEAVLEGTIALRELSIDLVNTKLVARAHGAFCATQRLVSDSALHGDLLLGHALAVGREKWLYSKAVIAPARMFGLQRPVSAQHLARGLCGAAVVAPNACTSFDVPAMRALTAATAAGWSRAALWGRAYPLGASDGRWAPQTGIVAQTKQSTLAKTHRRANGLAGAKLDFFRHHESSSHARGGAQSREQLPMAAAAVGSTSQRDGLDSTAACLAGAVTRSASPIRAALDSAWYPPVWVGDGLWIRQAYAVKQNDDGSLEVS